MKTFYVYMWVVCVFLFIGGKKQNDIKIFYIIYRLDNGKKYDIYIFLKNFLITKNSKLFETSFVELFCLIACVNNIFPCFNQEKYKMV